MKLLWFHLMPYTELPDDFRKTQPSIWVDIHPSLFDPRHAHLMDNDFMDELEYAADLTVVAGAGHLAELDRPDEVASAMPAWTAS